MVWASTAFERRFGTSRRNARACTEYDRTIRGLLGVTELQAAANVYPSTLLATDQAGGLTDVGWSAYQSVAEMIASQVMASPTLTANFLKCTPTTTGSGATCL